MPKQKYPETAKRNEKAANRLDDGGALGPEFSQVYEFGAEAALFDLAERLGLREAVKAHAGKPGPGLPIEDAVLLAAIYLAVKPASKNSLFEWFDKTVLRESINSATEQNLSGQGFWQTLKGLGEVRRRKIEDGVAKKTVSAYGLGPDCLLFDNENFHAYLDSSGCPALAKDENGPEPMAKLSRLGLFLVVSADHGLPLFHEIYPESKINPRRLSEAVENLPARLSKLGQGKWNPTVFFEALNDSDGGFKGLRKESKSYGVLTCLGHGQGLKLPSFPESGFIDLEGDKFKGVKALRSEIRLYGKEYTLALTYDPKLYEIQLFGLKDNFLKCSKGLKKIQESLKRRAQNSIDELKTPNYDLTYQRIRDLLAPEHMKSIFNFKYMYEGGFLTIEFYVSELEFKNVTENVLGKSFIVTDNDHWPTEKIVSAYQSKLQTERRFASFKGANYPFFDSPYGQADIEVHAFITALSLTLRGALEIEFERLGHKLSAQKILDLLSQAKQVMTVCPKAKSGRVSKSSFSKMNPIAKDYIERHGLTKYAIKP
ncbi:MAG: hypothetical protein LBF38_12790 [Deltaproteobacteria bacterium]|jgi:transposase|nr:hypothetical protein [Deltaproteobacteria bacterium]